MCGVDEEVCGLDAYLLFDISIRGWAKRGDDAVRRTFMLYLTLYTWFTPSSKTVSANELKVIRDVVHFLSFEVCDYDVYFITAAIVHPTQQHEFWKLHNKICGYRGENM